MSCAGVLLTGGASRRMGTDKATLVVRGETLAVRAGRVLAAVCSPVVEVGPGVSGLRSVLEDPPGEGPLAALLAGADALGVTDAPVLVLACDLPFVDAALLRTLATWPGPGSAVPRVGERHQYACARWSSAALAAGRAAFAAGERGLHVLATVDTDSVTESVGLAGDSVTESAWTELLIDVDTPDDLRRLGLS